ncbi:hypothetical protein RCL1_007528 [Eukaryota sp. TZLM3-RCL]
MSVFDLVYSPSDLLSETSIYQVEAIDPSTFEHDISLLLEEAVQEITADIYAIRSHNVFDLFFSIVYHWEKCPDLHSDILPHFGTIFSHIFTQVTGYQCLDPAVHLRSLEEQQKFRDVLTMMFCLCSWVFSTHAELMRNYKKQNKGKGKGSKSKKSCKSSKQSAEDVQNLDENIDDNNNLFESFAQLLNFILHVLACPNVALIYNNEQTTAQVYSFVLTRIYSFMNDIGARKKEEKLLREDVCKHMRKVVSNLIGLKEKGSIDQFNQSIIDEIRTGSNTYVVEYLIENFDENFEENDLNQSFTQQVVFSNLKIFAQYLLEMIVDFCNNFSTKSNENLSLVGKFLTLFAKKCPSIIRKSFIYFKELKNCECHAVRGGLSTMLASLLVTNPSNPNPSNPSENNVTSQAKSQDLSNIYELLFDLSRDKSHLTRLETLKSISLLLSNKIPYTLASQLSNILVVRISDTSSLVRKQALLSWCDLIKFYQVLYKAEMLGKVFIAVNLSLPQLQESLETADDSEHTQAVKIDTIDRCTAFLHFYTLTQSVIDLAGELVTSKIDSDVKGALKFILEANYADLPVWRVICRILSLLSTVDSIQRVLIIEFFSEILCSHLESQVVTSDGFQSIVVNCRNLIDHVGGLNSPNFENLKILFKNLVFGNSIFSEEFVNYLFENSISNFQSLFRDPNTGKFQFGLTCLEILVLLQSTGDESLGQIFEKSENYFEVFKDFLPPSIIFTTIQSNFKESLDAFLFAILKVFSFQLRSPDITSSGQNQSNLIKKLAHILYKIEPNFDWYFVVDEIFTLIFQKFEEPFTVVKSFIQQMYYSYFQNFDSKISDNDQNDHVSSSNCPKIPFENLAKSFWITGSICSAFCKFFDQKMIEFRASQQSEQSITQSQSDHMIAQLSTFSNQFLIDHSLLAPIVTLMINQIPSFLTSHSDTFLQSVLITSLCRIYLPSQNFSTKNLEILLNTLRTCSKSTVFVTLIPHYVDLIIRHPIIFEPYSDILFQSILSDDVILATISIKSVFYLTLSEIIKPRQNFIYIILAINFSKFENVKVLAESLVTEMSQKQKVLYNLMTSVIGNLIQIFVRNIEVINSLQLPRDLQFTDDDFCTLLKIFAQNIPSKTERDGISMKFCRKMIDCRDDVTNELYLTVVTTFGLNLIKGSKEFFSVLPQLRHVYILKRNRKILTKYFKRGSSLSKLGKDKQQEEEETDSGILKYYQQILAFLEEVDEADKEQEGDDVAVDDVTGDDQEEVTDEEDVIEEEEVEEDD